MRMKRLLAVFLTLLFAATATGAASAAEKPVTVNAAAYPVTASGAYDTLEEVAVYLTLYGRLPGNFSTKAQAQALGWDSRAGNLNRVAPGKSIGGDRFGNYEGRVPDAKGRTWTECDIGSDGGYRNGRRIVFSSDGLIYYTGDHYETFRQVSVQTDSAAAPADQGGLREDGAYLTRDDVAAYLHAYGRLPSNYLTRDEAKALGWTSKKDNLGKVAPGCAIGGDSFGNREGLLPDAKGRTWKECDVNTQNGRRSAERLVYSNDGLIYFTPDNHQSFERLF